MMLAGALALWLPMNLRLRPGHMIGALAGIGVGLSNGLAAMPGPPAIAYSLLTDLPANRARKSVVQGKSVSVRVDLGGRRIIQQKKREMITLKEHFTG